MIQANELRQNNYVYDVDGDILQIDEISNDYVKFKNTSLRNRLFKIKPIELTEEILLKCPSIENRNTHPISYYLHNRIIFINDGLCYDYATRVKLPYLHTFQNFIFALTDKELEIKL